jgi:cytochrome b pre-mRNA-processing protein 3
MLNRLMKYLVRPIASPAIESLYRTCVAQARHPVFYMARHVPDSVDGRFDLLILHVLLVIDRLKPHTQETQQLFDILFADMDKNLREMGVSDVSIAKKMKPMMAAFYGRAKAYEEALAGSDEPLAEALRRNIYGKTAPTSEDVQGLTRYVRRAYAALAAQKTENILAGHLTFPEEAQND